tara:strand:- start:490 stop:1410 length:921 start_codon:yes stop_codon:yes gene_type:complete
VIRAAQQGDVHGGLYVIDLDTEEVVHYSPYEKEFVNDNERGGERGLRGIVVLDDRIIVSDSAGFIELDRNTYEIKRTFQDRDHLKSIHEVVMHDDHIWATSTAHDAIAKYDLDFNLKGFWEILGHNKDDYKILTAKKEITADQKSNDDNFHINSMFVSDGRLTFSGLITPLYDFETMEKIYEIPVIGRGQAKSFVHNFYKLDGVAVANLTTYSSFGISYTSLPYGIDDSIDFVPYPVPRTKDAKFIVDDIASNNWNRGLAITDGKFIIGSSPARILVFDRYKGEFNKEIVLEKDIRHAIHGLEVLG